MLTIPRQVRELELAVSQPLGMAVLEIVTALASIGTALFFSWKLTLVILATFPLAAGVLYFPSKSVGPAIERQKRELSRASKYASFSVTAIDTVKSFNGQDQEVWQYFSTAKDITKYYLIQARANALQFGMIKFFAVGLYVSSFWFGLYLFLHDGQTVGHILTTFVSCASAMQAVEIILPQFLVLSKGISAGDTLKSIMVEMQDRGTSENEDGNIIPETCASDIEMNDVGNPSSLEASADLDLDFFRVSIKSEAKCVEQRHFLLPHWRNDIRGWQERIRKKHYWQPAHEILWAPVRRNRYRRTVNPNVKHRLASSEHHVSSTTKCPLQ